MMRHFAKMINEWHDWKLSTVYDQGYAVVGQSKPTILWSSQVRSGTCTYPFGTARLIWYSVDCREPIPHSRNTRVWNIYIGSECLHRMRGGQCAALSFGVSLPFYKVRLSHRVAIALLCFEGTYVMHFICIQKPFENATCLWYKSPIIANCIFGLLEHSIYLASNLSLIWL